MFNRTWKRIVLAVVGAVVAWPGCDREAPKATANSSAPPAVHVPQPWTPPPSDSIDVNIAGHSAVVGNRPAASSAPAASRNVMVGHDPVVPAFTPLVDAAVGEFAVYRDMNGRSLKYAVTQAGANLVTTVVEITDESGHRLGEPAAGEDRRDQDTLETQARSHSAQRTMRRERIQAAGRDWDSMMYEDRWTDEGIAYIRKSWVSPAVPVFGLLRMELHGGDRLEAKLELVRLGSNQSHR